MRTLALALGLAAAAAFAADPAKEIHGSGDGFAAPGIALAWAIERGATEAETFVVVRVAADTKAYPWISVVGIDPFTKAEQVRQPPTSIPNMLDVRIPRAKIADHPNSAFRFYASEADARANAPALVVYYHGVPDTAPELRGENAVDTHLIQRVTQLRRAPAKAP